MMSGLGELNCSRKIVTLSYKVSRFKLCKGWKISRELRKEFALGMPTKVSTSAMRFSPIELSFENPIKN